MVAKKESLLYVCSECGYQSKKWIGQCLECGNWNTMTEKFISEIPKNSSKSQNSFNLTKSYIGHIKNNRLNAINISQEMRIKTSFKELDGVLGGGIVNGSIILLSGSPGVGKSTLLLQISDFISQFTRVFYFSGEESEKQIKLRANRLNINSDNIFIFSENNLSQIISIIENAEIETSTPAKPGLVIIDSIQTIRSDDINSSAGSITQVREATNIFMNVAKSNNIPIIIVGHINKDGGIAGPKVLEHIVDTVLYFESEKFNSYKILRTSKNRFGPTNEIGIFEMQSGGLIEARTPSMALIESRSESLSGTALTCVMEGSRPIFIEVQALIAKSDYAAPRRVSTGFDYNRTCFILAVLEKKCGYSFGKLDVYVNVVGGIKLNNPSADLAIASALVSSLNDKIIDNNTVIIGELGLTGEIRPVSSIASRVNESIKLGFKQCVIPKSSMKSLKNEIDIEKISSLIKLLPVKYIWEYLK